MLIDLRVHIDEGRRIIEIMPLELPSWLSPAESSFPWYSIDPTDTNAAEKRELQAIVDWWNGIWMLLVRATTYLEKQDLLPAYRVRCPERLYLMTLSQELSLRGRSRRWTITHQRPEKTFNGDWTFHVLYAREPLRRNRKPEKDIYHAHWVLKK